MEKRELIGVKGKVIAYDKIYPYVEHLAKVYINGKYGFINDIGIEVIKPIYDNAHDSSSSIVALEKNNKWFFTDKRGKRIGREYEDVKDFHEGVAAVKENGKWGFIDSNGKKVIKCVFDSVRDFHEGIAHVTYQGLEIYINKFGERIFVLSSDYYQDGSDFQDGYIHAKTKFDDFVIINKEGHNLNYPHFKYVSDYKDGYCYANLQGDSSCILNKDGKVTFITSDFKIIGIGENGIFQIKYPDGMEGYIDFNGTILTNKKYKKVYPFKNNHGRVQDENLKYGFISAKGFENEGCLYDDAKDYRDGLAPVKIGNKWAYRNHYNFITPIKYDDANEFSSNRAIVTMDNHQFYIDIVGMPTYVRNKKEEEIYFYKESIASITEVEGVEIPLFDKKISPDYLKERSISEYRTIYTFDEEKSKEDNLKEYPKYVNKINEIEQVLFENIELEDNEDLNQEKGPKK